MKRLNPATGRPFKRGDTRDDGYRFRVYRYSRPLTPEGFYQEAWLAPDVFEKTSKREQRERFLRKVAFMEAVKMFKQAKGCVDCGYNASPYALQFDHLPGTEKLFGIGQTGNWTIKQRLAEMEKCEVVCANCHAVRTQARLASSRERAVDEAWTQERILPYFAEHLMPLLLADSGAAAETTPPVSN